MINVNTVLTYGEANALCVAVVSLKTIAKLKGVESEVVTLAEESIDKLGLTKNYEWYAQNWLQFLNKNLQ